MLDLMILDGNGIELKEKHSRLSSYRLSKNGVVLSHVDGFTETLSNILSVFSDKSCTVIRFKNETYVISKI